ncbi:MAG TPA: hypothetical protein VD931_21815 [Baekduia sp.]|nr:hypothetical protein [Baekduia sp.]
MRRLLCVLTWPAAVLGTAVAGPAPVRADTSPSAQVRTVTARASSTGEVRFSLRRVPIDAVRAATVRSPGGWTKRIAVATVRRAAPRGRLVVRVPRRVGRRALRLHLRLVAPLVAPQTTWAPPGTPPLSDAQAAGLVRRMPETRRGNVAANHRPPTAAELAAFRESRYGSGPNEGRRADEVVPQRRHVTGAFSGTTDEILQWAARKWGIPEDVVRAAAWAESSWRQDEAGDEATVEDPGAYPAHSRVSATDVAESLGILQIKWRPDGSLHPGTEPLRWKSTAFAADFWGANIRFFFDGSAIAWYRTQPRYAPGQDWLSVGAWYQPTPWANEFQEEYIGRVRSRLAERAWERLGP